MRASHVAAVGAFVGLGLLLYFTPVMSVRSVVVKPHVQGYVLSPLGAVIVPLLSLDR